MNKTDYEDNVISYLGRAKEGYHDGKFWAVIYLACAAIWALLNIADAVRGNKNE